MNDLVNQEWYNHLVEDCKAIITEKHYRAAQEVIECWHEVGKRICQENDNFERMYPTGQYLEVFSRERRPNWTVWGNQVSL